MNKVQVHTPSKTFTLIEFKPVPGGELSGVFLEVKPGNREVYRGLPMRRSDGDYHITIREDVEPGYQLSGYVEISE